MAARKKAAKSKKEPPEPLVTTLGAVGLRQATFPAALALSGDGRWLVTGDDAGVVRLCDLSTGTWVAERKRPPEVKKEKRVRELTLTADGGTLAARYHEWMWVIDRETFGDRVGAGTVIRDFRHDDLALPPGGATLLGREVWGMSRYDVATGAEQPRANEPKGTFQAMALAPDGRTVVLASCDDAEKRGHSRLLLLDAGTGAVLEEVAIDEVLYQAEVGFRADGRVVVADREGTLIEWRPGVKELRRLRPEPPTEEPGLWWLRLADTAAAGLGTVKLATRATALVDLDTGKVRGELRGTFQPIAVSADGSTLVVADGVTLDVRDARTLEPRAGAAAKGLSSIVAAVAFEPDGGAVWTGDDGSARRWLLPGGAPAEVVETKGWVHRLSRDGGRALVVVPGRAHEVVALPSGKRQGKTIPMVHNRNPDLTVDGGTVASAAGTREHGMPIGVALWSTATGERLHELVADSHPYTVLFSPSERLVASCRWDRTVHVWEVASGKVVARFAAPIHSPFALAFSPDEARLAIAGDERPVVVVELPSGTLVHSMKGHTRKGVWGLDWSADGARLASSDGKDTRLWDPASGAQVGLVRVGAITLAFSPDGRRLAAGGDGAAWVIELADRRPARS